MGLFLEAFHFLMRYNKVASTEATSRTNSTMPGSTHFDPGTRFVRPETTKVRCHLIGEVSVYSRGIGGTSASGSFLGLRGARLAVASPLLPAAPIDFASARS